MNEQSFTPGPWELLPAEDGVSYLRIRGTRLGGRYKVANVMAPTNFMPSDGIESEANARLIAAAPDLLNELINLTARFKAAVMQSGTEEEFAEYAIKEARAAIARALPQGAPK